MPIDPAKTVNPTSTIVTPTAIGRAANANSDDIQTTISANGVVSFNVETEAYPAAYVVFINNAANPVFGIALAYSASSTTVDVYSGVSLINSGGTSASNQAKVTKSGTTISITANATFGTNQAVKIARLF